MALDFRVLADLLLVGNPKHYLLRDEFSDNRAAGAVNGTPAVPGPGGNRGVTDTENKISISGGQGIISGGKAIPVSTGDPGWNWGSYARKVGLVLLSKHSVDATGVTAVHPMGWHATGSGGNLGREAHFLYVSSGGVQVIDSVSASPLIGTYIAGGEERTAVVARGVGYWWFRRVAGQWLMSFLNSSGSADPLFAYSYTFDKAYKLDFLRVPQALFIPPILAYDTFTRQDGEIGSTEGVGPDGQIATRRTWQGSAYFTVSGNKLICTPPLGAELLSNGGMETGNPPTGWSVFGSPTVHEQSAAQAHSGSFSDHFATDAPNEGIQQTGVAIVGLWYRSVAWARRVSGTYINLGPGGSVFTVSPLVNTWVQLINHRRATVPYSPIIGADAGAAEWYVDDASLREIQLADTILAVEALVTDVFASARLTTSPSLTNASGNRNPLGLILNLDSFSNPQNFVFVGLGYDSAGATSIAIYKFLAGVPTLVAQSVTVSYVAGARVKCSKIGTDYRATYNDVLSVVGTVSDAEIISNTKFGVQQTYEGDSIDEFELYASGKEGQYEALGRI